VRGGAAVSSHLTRWTRREIEQAVRWPRMFRRNRADRRELQLWAWSVLGWMDRNGRDELTVLDAMENAPKEQA
jgi:hypothetical protein